MQRCKVCNLDMTEIVLFTSSVFECQRCTGIPKIESNYTIKDAGAVVARNGYAIAIDPYGGIELPKLYEFTGGGLYWARRNATSDTYEVWNAEECSQTEQYRYHEEQRSAYIFLQHNTLVDEFAPEVVGLKSITIDNTKGFTFPQTGGFDAPSDAIDALQYATRPKSLVYSKFPREDKKEAHPWLTKAEVKDALWGYVLNTTVLEYKFTDSDTIYTYSAEAFISTYERKIDKGDHSCLGWRIKRD